MKKEIIIYVLLISILVFPLYRDKSVIDGIAYQWLFLSLFNLVSFLFLLFAFKNAAIDLLKKMLKNLYLKFYLIFLLIGSLSLLYTENISLGIVDLSRFYILFSSIISIYLLLSFLKNKTSFFNLITYIFLFFSSFEILQVFYPILSKLLDSTLIGRSADLKGITYNINVTAFSLVIKLPFLFLIASSKSKVKIIWSLSLIFFFLICIYQIQSRASYISLLLVFIILYTHKSLRKNYKLLAPIVGSIVFILFSGLSNNINTERIIDTNFVLNQDQSASNRLRYWKDATHTMLKNPLLGIGIGGWKTSSIFLEKQKIKEYVIPYHAHNDFLQIGAELGIIGFLTYLGLFILPMIYLIKIYWLHNKTIILILFASLAVILVDSTFNFPRERALIMSYYAILIAGTFLMMSSEKVKYEKHSN